MQPMKAAANGATGFPPRFCRGRNPPPYHGDLRHLARPGPYDQNARHDFLREEHSMCVDESPRRNPHRLLHDVGPVEVLNLEPVDAVTVTTLMDNSLDLFMPDQGPAHRVGPQQRPARQCSVMTDREVPDALIAEHGFSMLVTISKAGREHRVLFDAGASPDGVVENMRRLDVDPSSIGAIVCSHGHFDHTAGLDGLLRVLGPTGMPVLIHPHFWRRRRAVLPGREPIELPTTSATALREVGFDIIENKQPSFLLDPQGLVPAHCTGWRAQHAMAARFGEAFVPNSIGTRFTF